MDVDVRDIVREVFDIFAIQIEEKGLEMSLLFDESLPPILRLDAQRLKQVLVNLLGNSLKFTFRGYISVILIYQFSNDELKVTVADTGIGIKEEDRKKIFDMFCRIETSIKTSTSGIGLGLSITN